MYKKPLKSLSSKTLVVLGIGINSLCAVAADPELASKKQLPVQDNSKVAAKLAEGGCGAGMQMDMQGMVMHENKNNIPKDCPKIAAEVTLKVKAGVDYSAPYPGTVFGLDAHSWKVKPCSRITVEFKNEDEIRHQWMIHGLPHYLYPGGMFHIEANGLATKTGTFIVPSSHYTYLVHCDIAQHMEKGMKAQLVVGRGRKDLNSIPGLTKPKFADSFPGQPSTAQSPFTSETIE